MHSKEPVTQELAVLGTNGSGNKSGRIKSERPVESLFRSLDHLPSSA